MPNKAHLTAVRSLLIYFRDHDQERFDYVDMMNGFNTGCHVAAAVESVQPSILQKDLCTRAKSCGTFGCVAGWTLALCPEYIGRTDDLLAAAALALGLDNDQKYFLFCPCITDGEDINFADYKSENFDNFKYTDYDKKTETALAIQEAIDRIDYLLNRKNISNAPPITE